MIKVLDDAEVSSTWENGDKNVSSSFKDDSQIGSMFQFSLHNDSQQNHTSEIDDDLNHRMNDSDILSTVNEPDTTITDMDIEANMSTKVVIRLFLE